MKTIFCLRIFWKGICSRIYKSFRFCGSRIARWSCRIHWEENLTSIRKTNKDFAKYLEGNETEACYESFFAINGSPVMRANIGSKVFCLCSTINPEWEGEVVARNICASEIKEYWIFGSGMGYHVDALLKLDGDNKITLLLHEIEPISAALSLFDWREAIETGRLSFLYEKNERQLFEHLKKKKEDAVFFIHYPSLRCVRDKEVRELLGRLFCCEQQYAGAEGTA